jgi:hypothetical protein
MLTCRQFIRSCLLLSVALSAACSTPATDVEEDLERHDQAVWTRDAKGEAVQRNDGATVARNTVVRIPTKNLPSGVGDTGCTGVLLTPSLVLTSKWCIDPKKGTATPEVQVGSTATGLVKRTVVSVTQMPRADSVAGLDAGDLVLIKLALPATAQEAYLAASDRPTLQAPLLGDGVAIPAPPGGNRELPKIELVGWSPFAIDAKGESVVPTYAVQHRQFAQLENAYLYWLTGDGVAPFFAREVYALLRPGTARLGLHSGDVGSPLYYYASTGATKRQLIGLATAIGMNTTPSAEGDVIVERASPSAIPGTHCDMSRCDVWVDLTAPAAKKFIEDNAVQAVGTNWQKFHPRADGFGNHWYGESDVQTDGCSPGNNALDTDCDGWLNVNASLAENAVFRGRDNCPYLFNPGQADSNDDGVGDACESEPTTCSPSDVDCDGVIWGDNCPIKANPSPQVDIDRDGIGDACDECNDVVDNLWDGQQCAPSCTTMATNNESTGATLHGQGSRYSPDSYGSRGCARQWIMEFFPSHSPNPYSFLQMLPRLKRQDYSTAGLQAHEAYHINPQALCTGSTLTAELWARRASDKVWVPIRSFSSGFTWTPSSSCPANVFCPENCRAVNNPTVYTFPSVVPPGTYDVARMAGAVKAKWQAKTTVDETLAPLMITFGSW